MKMSETLALIPKHIERQARRMSPERIRECHAVIEHACVSEK